MSEKRFDVLSSKNSPVKADYVVGLDTENKVVPATGGEPVPDLKKIPLELFLLTKVDGRHYNIPEDKDKGTWNPGVTYNYGDVVGYAPLAAEGIDIEVKFVCAADGVAGPSNAPNLDLHRGSGSQVGVWVPLSEDGGAAIGSSKSSAMGLAVGDFAAVGGGASLAQGVSTSAGLRFNPDPEYMYKGEWSAGTYKEHEAVLYTSVLPAVESRLCVAKTETSAAPYNGEGALSGDWTDICEGKVLLWTPSLSVTTDDFVYKMETVNGISVMYVFRVLTKDGEGHVPDEPNHLYYETTYTRLVLAFVVNYYTIVVNDHNNFAAVPGLPLLYNNDGGPLPELCRSEACFLTMIAENLNSESRGAIVVFPPDPDHDSDVTGWDLDYALSNSSLGLASMYIVAMSLESAHVLGDVFGEGALASGLFSDSRSYAASAIGFNNSAKKQASTALGAAAQSEWIGELVHSSGIFKDGKYFDGKAALPMRSFMELATVGAATGSDTLNVVDPLSGLLAMVAGSKIAREYIELDDGYGDTNQSALYNIKVHAHGRVKDTEELVVYEGDIIIDMAKTGQYRLVKESWVQVYADALSYGSWTAPWVRWEDPWNLLRIDVIGTGIAAIMWSAHLDIKKTFIY